MPAICNATDGVSPFSDVCFEERRGANIEDDCYGIGQDGVNKNCASVVFSRASGY